ncbi:antibiotic acetyltransferase [Vibrio sp. 10N.286.49.C2]|uniref:CatB-related O-acetyltransferase n=1 Tax=unclassified Vibrio TaxID=2614977 RepID=UPI000C83ABBE|nr:MULTISPECIES: CatB-related O-acetyltransferase [unclassified Vibrio]PMH37282.1 antibiotic acetyltransferase [Vibrio sp. 10N.286.49.C2]PMH57427.1 antibiotic acetyltransferase [Vibrio sp. 10N.286.49.B1]PMH83273.1 antibiotic acetyltransferase [Vibrio sp. 10N.286.48.B7]
MNNKHWSTFQLLHEVVQNKNISIKGKHSYYSDCWDNGFEESAIRYLHGDKVSREWDPRWPIDRLHIGDYVCIAAETIILMGGNHNHRADWFCLYPFMQDIEQSYQGKGDTHIKDGAWLGMRCMIMPGVTIGEGAIVAANSVVTKDVAPYSVVAGSPAALVKTRFDAETITELLSFNIYDWSTDKFNALRPYLSSSDFIALKNAITAYDLNESKAR